MVRRRKKEKAEKGRRVVTGKGRYSLAGCADPTNPDRSEFKKGSEGEAWSSYVAERGREKGELTVYMVLPYGPGGGGKRGRNTDYRWVEKAKERKEGGKGGSDLRQYPTELSLSKCSGKKRGEGNSR